MLDILEFLYLSEYAQSFGYFRSQASWLRIIKKWSEYDFIKDTNTNKKIVLFKSVLQVRGSEMHALIMTMD